MLNTESEAKSNESQTTYLFDNHKFIKDITSQWNITSSFDDVKLDVNLIWLLFFLLLSMFWFTYILYYNSRLFGFILTKIVNLFIIPKYVMKSKNGDSSPYFYLGSVSVSAISGKIMFRDLVYITPDYSIRIQDGWLIYCWWIPYKPKDVRKCDFSHCDARISVFLNGFELHIYNRSQLYSRLEKLFNIYPRKLDLEEIVSSISDNSATKLTNDELIKAYLWRDFFPVTKFEILSARVVFGNPLVPSSLLFMCEESHITYTTRPAISPHDLFTHIMKCKADSFKIVLAPSPKYLGLIEEPPRYMGDGFVVFQSSSVDFYYYQDEPGVMSPNPENIELPSGDVVKRFTSPAWGLDVKCGKGTDCNYGPWADRQRDLLYNFFYPPDYQRVEVTEKSKEGELRIFESFEFRLSTLADTKIDILFSNKEKETNALHVNAGPGSYLEISIPYIAKEDGFATKIVGQILHLDATTILNYRSLVRSETLEFTCNIHYPLIWNEHQTWDCSFIGSKAIVSLIYEHKDFFNYLIDDWAGKARPDLLQFIPYTWKFNIILNEFELLTMANEHNWIDCTSLLGNENMQIAVCGETFEMSFDLPFVHFLPPKVPVKLWIQGESLEAAIHLPEANPHKDVIVMLHKFAKLSPLLPHTTTSASPVKPVNTSNLFPTEKKWRNVVKSENGWVHCWSVPIIALSITYTYHPVPPKASFPRESEITTPEKEEILLEPIRPDTVSTVTAKKCLTPDDFDPGLMDADLVELELEVGPSTMCLYGTLFRMLWNLKENYLGENQIFRDFNFNASQEPFLMEGKGRNRCNSNIIQSLIDGQLKPFDSRLYRPLDVTVSVTMHDIHGHIMKSCSADDPPCPHIYLERLCFEMKKGYRETKLQLLLSPVFLKSVDEIIRPEPHSHLQDGHLLMSSLQFRGHAMFSGLNRPLTSETLEYAWLVEVQIGRIVGRLTLPQIHHLVSGLETFVFQVMQEDSSLQPPLPYHKCVHDLIQSDCIETDRLNNKFCPYSENIKYRMVRVSVNSIDICVAEANTALSLELHPIRISTCNLHSCHSSSGVTLLIENISLRHFMMLNKSSLRTSKLQLSSSHVMDKDYNWFEVLTLTFGPVFVDSANLTSDVNNYVISQNTFLKTHDEKTKRLWFLWSDEVKVNNSANKCGCIGGCAFFGSNRSGVYFFNLNDDRENVDKLFHHHNGDIDFGESLLSPGEPLLGFELETDENEDSEEEITSLNFAPFLAKSGEQPLSPGIKTSISVPKSDDSVKPSIYLFPSTRSKSSKLSLFSRQMSSPARSSSGTANTPISSLNLQEPASISPSVTAPAQIQQTVTDKPLHKRNRSLSDSGAENGGLFVIEVDDTAKSVDQVNSNSLSTTSNDARKMSLESRSTTTITTDAYFSADEGESNSSNSDSLTLKTARSTMQATSIVSDDTFKSIQSMTTSSAEPTGLTEKVSMSQTMLNKSRVSLRSTCSAPPVNNRQKASNGDTQSISSSSFVSALSSQEDLDLGALVDLRNQMEKPIVDSQLLMSCYSNHLSRFKCKNWSLLDYDVQNDGRVLLKRSKWTSKFVKTSSTGLSYLKLTKKPTFIDGISDFGSLVQSKYRINDSYCPGCVFVKLKPENTHDDNKKEDESLKVKKQDDGEITKTFELRSEKVTVLIKLDQEIDIKISPLSLDGLRCFIDELIPTLTSLHPLTILNHLNVMCINRVEVNNQLKKEKTLQLGQFKLKAWRTTLERERNLQKNVNKLKFGENLAVSGDQNNLNKTQSAVTANQYEETKVTRIQAFLQMSKINIIVLQASLVEEMIASTALDNIKDITCVSLLAASINNIDFEFCNSKKEKRSLHTFVNTNPVRTPPTSAFASFAQHELVSRLFSKKPKKEHKEIEPLTIETHELLSQETMAVGKVGSFHAQLSRLTNSSSILRDAILTVIPHTQSKVNFEYTRSSFSVVQTPTVRRRSFQNKSTFRRQEGVEKEFDNVYIDTSCDKSSESDESQTDFIMFECGLEEISVQAVKNKNDSDKRVVSEQEKHKENTERKGASFVCGVGVVWFNFAAPPKTPITRKIDFTKLDWHLLSTATPSINAWLTVGERFIVTAKKMNHLSDQRISSIVASLMTCALEVQGIHIPPQSKHLSRKVTPFGKALQEDPSCQLMAVLRRYLKQVKSMDEIEENLTPAFLPSLSDLKRGVVALSRQWKNALYMPLLVEQNIKLNRGDKGVYQIGIPLKLLLGETVKPKEEIQVEFPLSPDTQEETENDDEHTILLPNQSKDYEKGSRLETQVTSEKKRKMSLSSSFPEGLNKASAKTVEDGGMCNGSAVKKTLPKSSRGSIAFPLLSNPLESLGSGVNKAYGFLFNANSQNSALKGKRQESQQSLKSSSSSSIGVGNNMSRDFFTSRNNESAEYHDENLYIWMLRQQEFVEARNQSSLRRISHSKNLDYDTRCNTLGSANSDDENMLSGEKLSSGKDVPPGFAFLPTSVQLADVRVIFTPLFTSLDIDLLPDEPESNLAFDQLGPKVSFCGCVKLFRVDIVECDREEAYSSRSRSPSTIDKLPGLPLKSTVQFVQFSPTANLTKSAFICERLSVDLDLRKDKEVKYPEGHQDTGGPVQTSESNATSMNPSGRETEEKVPIVIVGPEGGINELTTVVNFSVDVQHIVQRVNLPLLRLLHQFATMYENIIETRLEMRANRMQTWKDDVHFKQFAENLLNDISLMNEVDTQSATPSTSSMQPTEPKRAKQDHVSISMPGENDSDITLIDGEQMHVQQSHVEITQPKCWKTMYYLLDLYETTPETKTVTERATNINQSEAKIAIEEDEDSGMKSKGGYEQLKDSAIEIEESTVQQSAPQPKNTVNFNLNTSHRKSTMNIMSSDQLKTYTHALIHRELTPLIVFGVVKVRKVNLVAMFSGLKLDGEMSSFHVSLTHKEKFRGAAVRSKKWQESSLTGQLGFTTISLLEEIPSNFQLVVKMVVGKSQTLISTQNKKGKDANSALLTIGAVNIDIPQHPVALHGMVTRSSKQLSSTLQELRSSRQASRSSQQIDTDVITSSYSGYPCNSQIQVNMVQAPKDHISKKIVPDVHVAPERLVDRSKLIKPFVVQFNVILDSFTIGASLLPSLRAQYQIGQVTSSGLSGTKAKFVVDVREHSLSFNSLASESNLPSSASVSLPPIHVSAEYMEDSIKSDNRRSESFADGIVLRKGSFLNALADIGSFEHSLTTDLLNHLLLVQKVFMKEVNEVVQKMSGGDMRQSELSEAEKSVNDSSSTEATRNYISVTRGRYLLFTLHLRLKGIQITATTPTNSALRLETGVVELQLSNRVQNMLSAKNVPDLQLKLFFKLQVDLNVALGQLIKNALFEEAEPEFQQLAYFKTRIVMRNALQDELVSSITNNPEDKEAVLITLKRPLLYIQPLALDKAVLVWLNYKNAYEYWNEQRANLNKEVLYATQQVLGKVPQMPQFNTQTLGTLFLQLTVDDFGICLPISNPSLFQSSNTGNKMNYEPELKSALVITLENTRVSACSCGSLVSKAKFTGLCFRFADDFETSLDDWKPDASDTAVMNLCVVSEGTYEICSRTTTSYQPTTAGDAKWFLNVTWKMEGFDIHVDTSIGKQFSALFKTLTALAGDEDEIDTVDYSSNVDEAPNEPILKNGECVSSVTGDTPVDPNVITQRKGSLFRDMSVDTRKRSRLIEKELNEQAKIINDLRQSGANESVIELEIKKLHELESAVFNDFKRDVMKKLRRQSLTKKSSFREKLPVSRSTVKSDLSIMTPEESYDVDEQLSPVFREQRDFLYHESDDLTPITPEVAMKGDNPVDIRRDPSEEQRMLSADCNVAEQHSQSFPKTQSAFTAKNLLQHSSSFSPRISSTLFSDSTTSSSVCSSDSLTSSQNGNAASRSSSSEFIVPIIIETDTAVNVEHQQDLPNADMGANPPLVNVQSKQLQSMQEPNIDFELDVQIFFSSGKCVFHTKDKDDESAPRNGMKKERSFSGNPFESFVPGSPSNTSNQGYQFKHGGSVHKHSGGGLKANLSASRLRYTPSAAPGTPNLLDYTVFLIPGLDIKLHYNSKTAYSSINQQQVGATLNPNTIHLSDTQSGSLLMKKVGAKKASCYAWMTLHSIPEETIITPHILEFMEQALEPIPIQVTKAPTPTVDGLANSNLDTLPQPDIITSAPAQYAVYGSFPVDVIVYLHVQPSVLRFSCLPVSRVECLLQLPSVDLVFSSRRHQDEFIDVPSLQTGLTPKPFSQTLPPKQLPPKVSHRRTGSDFRHHQHPAETYTSGLSVTGCLADFSLYIFHPYRGQKKTIGNTLSATGVYSEQQFSSTTPKSLSDRKDSLSLQVEFVKINITRARNLVSTSEPPFPSGKLNVIQDRQSQTVCIKFSALMDIGSASFKYDMRRLTEILAFPKAWYRKALWKRMFLGEPTISGLFSDQEDVDDDGGQSNSSTDTESDDILTVKPLISPSVSKSESHIELKKQETVNREALWLNLQNTEKTKKNYSNSRFSSADSSFQQQRQLMNTPWDTLILFGINLSKLNVHMNMGNVMGNTTWLTRGVRSEGRVSIDSSGHKSFTIGLDLDGSSLDAKGGIVGGVIELSQIQTTLKVKENFGCEPHHVITLKCDALEKRLDYMGTSILMLRWSSLDLILRDEWKIESGVKQDTFEHPTKRPALIFIHCELSWDQLQIMMSKSTTPDIMKIIARLEEFFSQQFHSSKRVFSSLQPSKSFSRQSIKGRSAKVKVQPTTQSTGTTSEPTVVCPEARHHRHWQKALRLASGLRLSTYAHPLPARGTILGGTFELNGRHISLACFYGINFRSKSWGLFSLRQPHISFATEAQDVFNEIGETDTHIVQNFSFSLGRKTEDGLEFYAQHSSMAKISRISRTVMFPPQFRQMHEWFHYTFSISELDEVSRFPIIEFERTGDALSTSVQINAESANRRISMSPKSGEFHHNQEVIFALPSFQMELKTEHLQGPRTPILTESKPNVDCTFVTDFDDHIYVAVDAEAYFFLHELITSYIKEKDVSYSKTQSPATSERTTKGFKNADTIAQEKDFREFVCHTWHLEPTVRLLSWAGKNIEPYGVDYILQRLGFNQARTTIPKWTQRGAMDPLDKILSLFMLRVISAIKLD